MEIVDLFGTVTTVAPARTLAPAPRPAHEQLGLFADERGQFGGQTTALDVLGELVDGVAVVGSNLTTVRTK